MVEIILFLVWYVIGCLGFIYWYTSKNDFISDLSLVTVTILSGILGIFNWVIGYVISHKNTTRVLIKRGKR
jgi:hypothetical protein